jgi:hypothetical protein
MLTSTEKRMMKNLRAMTVVIVMALLVVLIGQQEKEAMIMEMTNPSVYEIAQMEERGYEYEVTEDGLGYFIK